jgi:hypothetical protein
MGFAKSEAEIAERLSAFLKAEIAAAEITYAELAQRMKTHGHRAESAETIKQKLKRGTFSATFLLAAIAALELEGVSLEEI